MTIHNRVGPYAILLIALFCVPIFPDKPASKESLPHEAHIRILEIKRDIKRLKESPWNEDTLRGYEKQLAAVRELKNGHDSTLWMDETSPIIIECLHRMGRIKERDKELESYLESLDARDNTKGASSRYLWGWVISLCKGKEYPDALNMLGKIEVDYPKDRHCQFRVRLYRGYIFYSTGNNKEALSVFEKLYKEESLLRQTHEQLLIHYAQTQLLENRYEQTAALLNEYLNKYPKGGQSDFAMYQLAWTLCSSNKTLEGRRLFQELISKYPNSRYTELAKANLDNIDRAILDMIKGVELINE